MKYEDAWLIILTSKDNLGTLVEVLREHEGEDEEIDVSVLTGAGDRAEGHLGLARIIAEIFILGSWTGNKRDRWIKATREKKILISVCVDKEEGAQEDELLNKDTIKTILNSTKTLLSENLIFLFN